MTCSTGYDWPPLHTSTTGGVEGEGGRTGGPSDGGGFRIQVDALDGDVPSDCINDCLVAGVQVQGVRKLSELKLRDTHLRQLLCAILEMLELADEVQVDISELAAPPRITSTPKISFQVFLIAAHVIFRVRRPKLPASLLRSFLQYIKAAIN